MTSHCLSNPTAQQDIICLSNSNGAQQNIIRFPYHCILLIFTNVSHATIFLPTATIIENNTVNITINTDRKHLVYICNYYWLYISWTNTISDWNHSIYTSRNYNHFWYKQWYLSSVQDLILFKYVINHRVEHFQHIYQAMDAI